MPNEIKNHKARLNIHSGKQVYGANYYETYASDDAGWDSHPENIQLMLVKTLWMVQ